MAFTSLSKDVLSVHVTVTGLLVQYVIQLLVHAVVGIILQAQDVKNVISIIISIRIAVHVTVM